MKPLGEVTHLVIHHSATPGGNVEAFRREHKARGFDDIGYHAVICNGRGGADGMIEPGRSEQFQGAGVYRNNRGKLHVCLVGNFETAYPTDAQLETLGDLLDRWLDAYPKAAVVGHKEVTLPGHPTACPGRRFPLDAVRAWCRTPRAEDLDDFVHALAGIQTKLGADNPPVASTRIPCTIEVASTLTGVTQTVLKPKAVVVEGRTYVCLRDLCEGLGWEGPDVTDDGVLARTRRRKGGEGG